MGAAVAAAAATGFVGGRGVDRVKVSEPISENPYWVCELEKRALEMEIRVFKG